MRKVLALTAVLMASCSRRMPGAHLPAERRAVVEAARHKLQAGTARIDVTPPPGPSTFGHGPDAHVADGYWTRLYCRAFVLERVPGEPLAIVPCDLAAISGLLHRSVAERVGLALGKDVLPASRIMLSATHTHAGPAHYFESPAYGGNLSTRAPGFDQKMLDFLADRIGEGVARAYRNRVEASARWVHGCLGHLTRNRSPIPFSSNESPPLLQGCPAATGASEGTDPALDVLEIEEGQTEAARVSHPLGWLVFFAMHPTVLPSANRLFGGDAFGCASRWLESELRRIRAGGGRCADGSCDPGSDSPLAGLINTNEGDISPIWSVGDRDEAISIGWQLAKHAFDEGTSSSEAFSAEVAVDSRYVERHLPGAELEDHVRRLAAQASLGAASGHGGSDHPTSLDALISTGPEIDLANRSDPKAPLLGSLQPIMLGKEPTSFPVQVPFALARLAETFVSFAPAEMTYAAGASVNARILQIVRPHVPKARAIVGGLSNAYMQYVATAREYGMQHYEGGSTLYGPNSADYFAEQFEALAKSFYAQETAGIDQAAAFDYQLAPERKRFPRPRGSSVEHGHQIGLCRIRQDAPAAICFWWLDAAPGDVPLTGPLPWIQLVRSDGSPVRSCGIGAGLGSGSSCDPGASIDDRGMDFETRIRHRNGEGWVWSTVFFPTQVEWSALQSVPRLHLRAGTGARGISSDPFSVPRFEDLPVCPNDTVRACLTGGEWEVLPADR